MVKRGESGMKYEVLAKASEIVKSLDHCTIAVIDDDGFPRASSISNIKAVGLRNMWFSTGLSSGKVRCLEKNNKASVCYQQEGQNITLMGTIEILTNEEIKRELWVDWFIEHFPEGPNDPNYCILKFSSQKGVLWVDRHYFEFDKQDIESLED